MTTNTAEDFYDGIDGAMTPEQAAMALAMAETGDTGTTPDNGGAPTTTPGTDDSKATGDAANAKDDGKQTPSDDQLSADNAVILAKDGKHTIPFEHLEKARQQREEYRVLAETAQRQLAELQAQAQARVDAGQAPTKTDNMVAAAEAAIEAGADVGLFGDFSEEALAAGIQKLVAQQVQAEVAQAIKPMQAKHQQDAAAEHTNAIYTAHPNADSIVQSEQFKAWVDSHPTTVRAALWATFDTKTGGTAAEVVEVLDAYVKANTSATPTPAAPDAKAAAQAAAKAAQAAQVEAPTSLTFIPGGRADGATPNERMAELNGTDLYAALEGKTAAQIEAFLNQQL